ncbi:unnamed protein product [marine sediment metagenome]|uniref:Uncharacterized protein n=1 Tax=marine sediment metagenome TaxID=412755 RepID=X0W940_9ZZZZ
MDECIIKVGDQIIFVDTEGKTISTETVEEIFRQYGRIQVKCKEKTHDHHFWGIQVVS